MMQTQIKCLYEQGIDLETISEMLGVELNDIKIALISSSSKYRSEIAKKEKTFSNDDYEMAKLKIGQLIFAENESVALRASKFILNENLGRNTKINNISSMNINISLLNEQMIQAKKAIEVGKNKQTIDVISKEDKHLVE